VAWRHLLFLLAGMISGSWIYRVFALKLSTSSRQLIILDHPHDICHTGGGVVKMLKSRFDKAVLTMF